MDSHELISLLIVLPHNAGNQEDELSSGLYWQPRHFAVDERPIDTNRNRGIELSTPDRRGSLRQRNLSHNDSL